MRQVLQLREKEIQLINKLRKAIISIFEFYRFF